MKRQCRNMIVTLLAIITLGLSGIGTIEATSLSLVKDFPVSSGNYFYQLQSETPNRMNVLDIDLTDPYTDVALSYPKRFSQLQTTTNQALNFSSEKQTAVGAINGSFYHIANKEPIGLISEYNRLIHMGYFTHDLNNYVNQPIAFGVNRSGKAMIDTYTIALTYELNGQKYAITSMNKERNPNQLILYTDDYKYDTTHTNNYGIEIVVETNQSVDLVYGDTYAGVVTQIREYGDSTPLAIPKNGFVLSGNGDAFHQLKDIAIGEMIKVSAMIDDKWQQAKFMLASGPQLVKNNQVAITMNTNSQKAKEVAPRSAVGIDASGDHVYFITVDGRQSGYSKGMTLMDFARYLVELGVDRAINLDGGGSTTMSIRKYGDDVIRLFNRPSDGRERGVSSVLLALTSEPSHHNVYFKDIKPGDSHYESVRWISGQGIKGYEDANFRPNTSLSRMHASIMFTKTLDLSMTQITSDMDIFTDVASTHVYANYIATMKAHHIFGGSNGFFYPSESLTREQMASTIVRAFNLSSSGEHVNVRLSNVSDSHKQNVQILADLGITSQLNDFRPKEPVTRAQFATFLYNTTVYLNS